MKLCRLVPLPLATMLHNLLLPVTPYALRARGLSGVNYFFGWTTTISPGRRQL
jgi:hypothetical protein